MSWNCNYSKQKFAANPNYTREAILFIVKRKKVSKRKPEVVNNDISAHGPPNTIFPSVQRRTPVAGPLLKMDKGTIIDTSSSACK